MKRISVFLPEPFIVALEKLAAKKGSNVSQLIRDAIHAFLKAAGALYVLLVIGCAQSPSESEEYSERIREWQTREQASPEIVTQCPEAIDIVADIGSVLNEAAFGFRYRTEKGNYWKTSFEAIRDGFGDCEDSAAIAYRVISDSCLVARYGLDVRMRAVDIEDSDDNHVIAIAYTDSGEFVEISNLFAKIGESDRRVIAEFTESEIY